MYIVELTGFWFKKINIFSLNLNYSHAGFVLWTEGFGGKLFYYVIFYYITYYIYILFYFVLFYTIFRLIILRYWNLAISLMVIFLYNLLLNLYTNSLLVSNLRDLLILQLPGFSQRRTTSSNPSFPKELSENSRFSTRTETIGIPNSWK